VLSINRCKRTEVRSLEGMKAGRQVCLKTVGLEDWKDGKSDEKSNAADICSSILPTSGLPGYKLRQKR
jgi:hypothetical protein